MVVAEKISIIFFFIRRPKLSEPGPLIRVKATPGKLPMKNIGLNAYHRQKLGALRHNTARYHSVPRQSHHPTSAQSLSTTNKKAEIIFLFKIYNTVVVLIRRRVCSAPPACLPLCIMHNLYDLGAL